MVLRYQTRAVNFFALNAGKVSSELKNLPIQVENVFIQCIPNTVVIRLSYFYEHICYDASKN